MSKPHKWINDSSLYEKLKNAILVMCSHRPLKDRLRLSKQSIYLLPIENFPPEHLQQARIILENTLYKLDDSGTEAEVTATDEEIDTYAQSLFELYKALLRDLSNHRPESFEIFTTPEYKLEELMEVEQR